VIRKEGMIYIKDRI